MSSPRLEAGSPAGLGDLLRYWRGVRRMSQLDLASEAGTTPRYVSFVETGRSQPSRQMVVRLARALDVPLRERNGLLVAAGYAPMYALEPLGSPQLGRVDAALTMMLDQHEPFPAVVMDRGWDLLRANSGAQLLFGGLLGDEPMPEPANVLRLMVEPGPVRRGVRNWSSVVPALLDRARREAIGGVLDRATADLVARLGERSDVAALLAVTDASPPTVPVVDVSFGLDGETLDFFSVVSTIGTPVDVTAEELRVEAFFPSDEATRETWRRLASGAPAPARP
jgi:transcriptional regulator with XRE-family HTH domain